MKSSSLRQVQQGSRCPWPHVVLVSCLMPIGRVVLAAGHKNAMEDGIRLQPIPCVLVHPRLPALLLSSTFLQRGQAQRVCNFLTLENPKPFSVVGIALTSASCVAQKRLRRLHGDISPHDA